MRYSETAKLRTNVVEFIKTLPAPLTREGLHRASDKDLAKAIRRDLALASASSSGPLPRECKFSVRVDHYNSIHVEVTNWAGRFWTDAYIEHLMDPQVPSPVLCIGQRFCHFTAEFGAALFTAELIASRHNYDRSDTMVDIFDVGYYLTVSSSVLESVGRQGLRMETDPEYAALVRAGYEAAEALGAKVIKSLCGSAGLAGASEWTLKKLVATAERADGRPLVYDKRRGWIT